jgi:hypothetical protein
MKAWIRKHSLQVRSALNHSSRHAKQILRRAVLESITAEKAEGWYRHSGYL